MNQSDEDALVRKAISRSACLTDSDSILTKKEAIRLAIRAAYAKGAEDAKERAANRVRELGGYSSDGLISAIQAANAIRRG